MTGFYHFHAAPQISVIQTDFLRKLLNADFLMARSLEPWLIHANNELGKQMSCEIIACEWHGGNKWCSVLDHADGSTRGKEKGELFSHSRCCVGLSWLLGNKVPCCIKRQSNFLPRGSHNYTQKGNIGFSGLHVEITFDYRIDRQKEVTGFQFFSFLIYH